MSTIIEGNLCCPGWAAYLWMPVALSWPGRAISLAMDDEWRLRAKNVAAALVAWRRTGTQKESELDPEFR